MRTFPIMLLLEARLAVVIGAGKVGLRKAASLLEARAKVRLVTGPAQPQSVPPGVELIDAPYHSSQLEGAAIVFAATGDARINRTIVADARAAGALANAVDQPEDCDFYSPAVIRRGDVQVAITTGGSAPGFSATLRNRLEPNIPLRAGEFAALLTTLREALQQSSLSQAQRMDILRKLTDDESLDAFLSGGPKRIEQTFEQLLREAAS